jgi:uracil-DNA glycosylase
MIDSYHCSRYNTQTRRLTTDMFQKVLKRSAELAGLI